MAGRSGDRDPRPMSKAWVIGTHVSTHWFSPNDAMTPESMSRRGHLQALRHRSNRGEQGVVSGLPCSRPGLAMPMVQGAGNIPSIGAGT